MSPKYCAWRLQIFPIFLIQALTFCPFETRAEIPEYPDIRSKEAQQQSLPFTQIYSRHANNHTFSEKSVRLRVLDLNTWGLPWPISLDRETRFRALREVIAHSTYDVILLQEVWFRSDHELLRTALPHSTYFGIFNSGCSGYLLPIGCSGLTILSRHPFEGVEFTPFKLRGSFWSFDGEIFVHKGLGRARIDVQGFKIDLFTTHLVSYTRNPNRENRRVRYKQTQETVKYIAQSNADVKIFSGDVNALPLQGPDQPYTLLTSLMTDSLVDKYPNASYHPWFATFGNHHNTYTHDSLPERIDYLMYWAAPNVAMKTVNFTMPMFNTVNKEGQVVSLSDHEALQADFLIERRPAAHRRPLHRNDKYFRYNLPRRSRNPPPRKRPFDPPKAVATNQNSRDEVKRTLQNNRTSD